MAFRLSPSSESHPCLTHHYELIRQPITEVLEQSLKHLYLRGCSLIFQPQKDDPSMKSLLPINLLPKTLVIRY